MGSLNKNVVNMLYSINGFGGDIDQLYDEIEAIREHAYYYNLTEEQIQDKEREIAKIENEIDEKQEKLIYNFEVLKTILENVDEETIVNALEEVAQKD